MAKRSCCFITHSRVSIAEGLDESVHGGNSVGPGSGKCHCRSDFLLHRVTVERLNEWSDRRRPHLAKCECRSIAHLRLFAFKGNNEARNGRSCAWAKLGDGYQRMGANLFILIVERFDQRRESLGRPVADLGQCASGFAAFFHLGRLDPRQQFTDVIVR